MATTRPLADYGYEATREAATREREEYGRTSTVPPTLVPQLQQDQ